jgi:integrase
MRNNEHQGGPQLVGRCDHGQRRTFGSWLANRGTGMDVIAKQLGHRSTRIIARHYTQFTPEYLSAQVLATKQVFSPSRPSAD